MAWFADKTARVVVSGPTGTGKSFFLKRWLQAEPRVLCVDALEEYDLPYFRDIRTADAWFAARRPDRFRIGIRVPADEADVVLRYAWALRPCLTIVEESDMLAPPSFMPRGAKYLTNYGRRFGLGVWWVTRRPANLNRAITANARYLVVFPTQEPLDRDYLNEFIPGTLQEKCWTFLDGADRAGYCIVVDTRSRTVILFSPNGGESNGIHQEPAGDRPGRGDRGEDRRPADPDHHQAERVEPPAPDLPPSDPPSPESPSE